MSARNPPLRRTRTGCLTCRERRVKCDENHPACNRCVKSMRECTFPVGAPALRRSPSPPPAVPESSTAPRYTDAQSTIPAPLLGFSKFPPNTPRSQAVLNFKNGQWDLTATIELGTPKKRRGKRAERLRDEAVISEDAGEKRTGSALKTRKRKKADANVVVAEEKRQGSEEMAGDIDEEVLALTRKTGNTKDAKVSTQVEVSQLQAQKDTESYVPEDAGSHQRKALGLQPKDTRTITTTTTIPKSLLPELSQLRPRSRLPALPQLTPHSPPPPLPRLPATLAGPPTRTLAALSKSEEGFNDALGASSGLSRAEYDACSPQIRSRLPSFLREYEALSRVVTRSESDMVSVDAVARIVLGGPFGDAIRKQLEGKSQDSKSASLRTKIKLEDEEKPDIGKI